jgi:hypothetical protein
MRVRAAGKLLSLGQTRKKVFTLALVAACCTGIAPVVGQSPPSIHVDCGSESLQDAVDTAPPETTLVVQGTCGPIDIRKNVTLVGTGLASIVARKSDGRAATVSVASGRAALSGITIVGGRLGMEVFSGARATLLQVAVRSTEEAGIWVREGGNLIATDLYVGHNLRAGLRIDGLATISRSVIERNQWEGIALDGREPVTIEDTTVRDNSSDGILMDSDDLRIRRSHVTRNGSHGLAKYGPGVLSIQQSSFTYNRFAGVNVDQSGVTSAATVVRVTNSTFAFNQKGFAVRILEDLRHELRLSHVTLVRNTGEGLFAQEDVFTEATVVSGNGEDCDTPEGRVWSLGWTLIASPGPCVIVPGSGDLLGVAAHLGTIATHGVTQFVPLLPKSPGIDRVPVRPTLGGVGTCVTNVKTDQRGMTRPVGPGCDIGAIERRPGDL